MCSASTELPECEGKSDKSPSYFGEPLWQDMRLIASFGMGILCMHAMEALQGRQSSDEVSDGVLERKFEMYPYAL